MLPSIFCIYFSYPLFISPRAPIATGIVEAFTPTFFQFRCQGPYILTVFQLLYNWSVLFNGDGHINQQAAFFFCLFLITMSGLLALSHNLSALEYPTRLWCCLFLLVLGLMLAPFLYLFCCNWSLKLCSPYSPMRAFLDISQSSLWNVVTICFILPLS